MKDQALFIYQDVDLLDPFGRNDSGIGRKGSCGPENDEQKSGAAGSE